jgi:hypothetical protein
MSYQDCKSGAAILKDFAMKGPISQMNDKNPEIHAVRKRRDLVGKKQTIQGDK